MHSIYSAVFVGDRPSFLLGRLIAGLDHLPDAKLAGSGTLRDAAEIKFRCTSEAIAVRTARALAEQVGATPTLSTGMGVHHRVISLKGNTMATKYELVPARSESKTFSRKDAAIKAGEKLAEPFRVFARPSDALVHEVHITPTTEESTMAKTDVVEPEASADTPTLDVEFEGLAKYYVRPAGLHGAEVIGKVYGVTADLTGNTIHLYGSTEDAGQVAEHLLKLWPAAKVAHREYRKVDEAYSGLPKSRKNADANTQRWDLEVAWFIAFMNGAADALAGTVKRKGGAYKDGVKAVQQPADEGADVI